METKENPLYGITELELLNMLETSKAELRQAIIDGYKSYAKDSKNGKKRIIEEPNDTLMTLLKRLVKPIQQLPCPDYCKCGWTKQNALLNAQAHANNFTTVTMDITDFYPNTLSKFVREGLKKELNISEKALDIIIEMATYNNHLPTGAPTSTILAFIAHKELFDYIAQEMGKRGITYTQYVDDITLSAIHGITYKEVRFIQTVLNKHGLRLKSKKTKFYNYKKALITGYYLKQNGKISVPNRIGQTIIQMLETKSIKEMDVREIKKLLGYIEYQRQADKRAFKITRIRAIKQQKRLIKMENQKGE